MPVRFHFRYLYEKMLTEAHLLLLYLKYLPPDLEVLLRSVAEKVGTDGIDAYSLLSKIGHDCVGALQFIADGTDFEDSGKITGETVEDDAIEKILNNLVQALLGLKQQVVQSD